MPGIKPGMTENLVLMPRVECGLLRGRFFLLVLRLPLLIGHAVDLLAALVLSERNALSVGRFLHPVAEAIAAEAREIHQVDVLHLGARAQMLDEAAEHRGVEFGLGFFVESHGDFPALSAMIWDISGRVATNPICAGVRPVVDGSAPASEVGPAALPGTAWRRQPGSARPPCRHSRCSPRFREGRQLHCSRAT